MTEPENKPAAYPEYDENGNRNPVRVPPTEASEEWELETIRDNAEYDPYDIDTLANEPNH
ncbi:hypothetical protein [Pseudarthrobacter sp. NamB4]|uniref:hypothetical protein n=1 Tax=Pseudarthrobacter sp. NamB4 TaxID=2576837 RepID=UPI0010FE4FF6|nr:hypothetical protein [Pseudarthrobacter sp. NamB4]TLM75970.1 hypothetical protein FDW81_01050 [Pseudarthrobacter sp. NamB4]